MTISKFNKVLTFLLILMGFIHNSYATNIKDYTFYEPIIKLPEIDKLTNINLSPSPKPKLMGVIIDEIELKVISVKKIADSKLDIEFTLMNKAEDDEWFYIGDPSLAGGFSERKFKLVDNNGFIYIPETITVKSSDGTWISRYATYLPFSSHSGEPEHYILTYPDFDPEATSISLLRIYLGEEGGRFYQLTDIPVN